MEINNYIDNSPTIGSDLSTLSSSMNIKALDSVNVVGEGSNSFSIEFNTQERRSDLSLSLRNMMEDISVSQVALQNLNEQSTILSNIQEMVSGDNQSLLEEIQPSVEELLSKYNSLSTDINKNFAKYQEETDSRNYFDGMLGSKPLNPAEIIKAVEQQQEVVKAEKKFFGDNVEKVADKALEVINIEIDKSNKEAPFKNIDFGKNTADFTSANINNVVGSVVSSQANAIPANSPKLLA
ncbi:MAG: hypothetical protein RBT59_08420 [Arcobacteraceae bacterium]|jgi:hypothetical protein|nr:hypothetical protein [Arcobacteraceae bacterium]